MKHALRSLAKSPGFTLTALITLALGIGANATSFSVLNALLLHTVPYPRPDELVRLYRNSPDSNDRGSSYHAPANFRDHREQNEVFAGMAAWQWSSFNFADPGQPADRLRGMHVTANFFTVLGVAPALGRTFTPQEDSEGNNAVAIISHGLWLQRFAADPNILGRRVRLNSEPVEIVGVLPPTFDDYLLWGDLAVWRPLALTAARWQDRDNNTLNVLARLKPGVTQAQAQSAMSGVAARLAAAYPRDNARSGLRLMTLSSSAQDGTGRRITTLVMGLATFVLLIACANLANLQFARNAARVREHAIRAALGATRAQLMRQTLVESILLSLAGGALGLLLAVWTNELVGSTFVLGDRVGLDMPLDRRVLGFTFAVSLLTGIGFGLLPAWLAARTNVNDALKQGGRGTSAGRSQHRVRHALIVAEVALALMLLAGAGFFYRGLQRFTHRDPGWQTEGLLTAYINLRGPTYAEAAGRQAFFQHALDRLGNLPGVERATIASSLPTHGFSNTNGFAVEGQPEPAPGQGPNAASAAVMPGFFATLGIPLVQGRDFDASDRSDSRAVVIINESMARKFWPGENPIGKRLGNVTPYMENPREIIGVVRDVRPVAQLGEPDGRLQMYRPLSQRPVDMVTIALRTRGAPEALAGELRRAIAAIDPDQAVFRIGTIRHEVQRTIGSIDSAAYALLSFALLGLLLAAVGIYGVISNSVVQRTNEIGIRLALGAQVRDILTLIVGGGLRLTVIGTVLGLIGAAGVARLVRAVSPEFAATETGLTVAITLFLIGTALFACWLPARRATRVDPISALRAE